MRAVNLTLIELELIAALDSGKFDDLTLEDVQSHIRDGDIFPLIQSELGHRLDIGAVKPEDIHDLTEALQRLENAVPPSDLRINRKGLCLLLAYINELVKSAYINDRTDLLT